MFARLAGCLLCLFGSHDTMGPENPGSPRAARCCTRCGTGWIGGWNGRKHVWRKVV